MTAILRIEQEMGRRRVQKKGPRPIDIDILLFDDGSIMRIRRNLTIPHPAMHQRRFVLEPLAEIAPEVLHPVLQEDNSRIARCAARGADSAKAENLSHGLSVESVKMATLLYGTMIRLPLPAASLRPIASRETARTENR